MPAPHARKLRRRTTARARGERGAAAVEFALVVPILLILVFGIIQYGVYFWSSQGASDIARSAARLSSVGKPASCAAFRAEVEKQIQALAGSGASAVIKRTYSTAPPNVKIGDTVTVTVQFRSLDLKPPLIPTVKDGLVTTTVTSRVDYAKEQPEPCL